MNAPTEIIDPTNFNDYDPIPLSVEDEIDLIKVGDMHNKGGQSLMKIIKDITKLSKEIKSLVATKNSLFSPSNINSNSECTDYKKLFYVLYCQILFCYQNYNVYQPLESDSFFEKACEICLDLHQLLQNMENCQLPQQNTSNVLKLISENLNKMKQFSNEMQQKSNNGSLYSQLYKDWLDKKQQLFELNPQDSVVQKIGKHKQQTLVIAFIKLVQKILNFEQNRGKNKLQFLEVLISEYLEKLTGQYNKQYYLLFDYFKEAINKQQIHHRFNLIQDQIKQIGDLIQKFNDAFEIIIQNDTEKTSLKNKNKTSQKYYPKDIIQKVMQVESNLNFRNQSIQTKQQQQLEITTNTKKMEK